MPHLDFDKAWDFADANEVCDSVITGFQMKVLPDLGSFAEVPFYNQTVIEYRYITRNGEFAPPKTSTGLIENEKNIWLHPPRSFLFRILELNPFPFIQKPYEKGNTWNWALKIGDFWSDERWMVWENTIENSYHYEITHENLSIETPIGHLNCYKVESHASSRIGKTFATLYFNDIYGFVFLEYLNIDGSKIIITLQERR